MKIRLRNIRRVGRYTNPSTQTAVNIFKGEDSGGFPYLFYYYRQKRQFVAESEFWGKWKKVEPKHKTLP